jgi:serine-type D-Ala-D-Ala endopeptidase (penicillin-binding protein 7)
MPIFFDLHRFTLFVHWVAFCVFLSWSMTESAQANTAKADRTRSPVKKLSVKNNARTPATGLALRSSAALVTDDNTGAILYEKNIDSIGPIASLTKLMTAMVILDSGLSLDATIRVENSDIDFERGSKSKMRIGEVLPRGDLLRLALMSSENRAAAALARTYPGGPARFVALMNQRAAKIGMTSTWFVDSSGLSSANVSTPRDLARLVAAAARYDLIRQYSTTPEVALTRLDSGQQITYRNTNLLVRHDTGWEISLSKTGYLDEAGHCLVLQAKIGSRLVNIVLLDSWGRYSRVGDANRIRQWLQARTDLALGAM